MKYKKSFLLILCLSGLLLGQTQEKTDFAYGSRLYQEGLYDLAVIQFSQFIEKYPESPESARGRFLLAQSHFRQGNYAEARREYLGLIVLHPNAADCPEAQYRIGECFEQTGNPSSAISSFSRVHAFYPRSVWAERGLYRAGLLAFETKDYIEAESAIRTLIDATAGRDIRIRALLLLSDTQFAQDRFESAIASLSAIRENPEAQIRLARIHGRIGHYEKSEQALRSVLRSTRNDTLRQIANHTLARQLATEGKADAAVKHFQESARTGPSQSLRASSILRIGKIHEDGKRDHEAFAAYDAAFNLALRDSVRDQAFLGKARSLIALGRFHEAVALLKPLEEQKEASPGILQNVYLLLSRAYSGAERHESAVQAYLACLKIFPEHELNPWVHLRIAEIQIHRLGMLTEGLFQLTAVWNLYPASRAVPEARFLYAVGLEKSRRFDEAEQIHRVICRTYPGSVWAERSGKRLELYAQTRKTAAVPVITDQRNLDTVLGDYWMAARDFHRAVAHYRLIRVEEDAALYRIVTAYRFLYTLESSKVYADSLRKYVQKMANNADVSVYDAKAKTDLAEIETDDDPGARHSRYIEILDQYPDHPDRDRIFLEIGRAAFESGLPGKALETLARSHDEAVPFWKGRIFYSQDNPVEADSVFSRYLRQATNPTHTPAVLYYLASIQERNGLDSLATVKLEVLNTRYRMSTYGDSSGLALGRMYLKQKRYPSAIAILKTVIREDSISQTAALLGLRPKTTSRIAQALFGLAEAYEGSRNDADAKDACFRVFDHNPGPRLRTRVFQLLSRIAEREGYPGRAIEYEEESGSQADSTHLRIGRLRFQQGEYAAAVKSFLSGLGANPPDDLSLELQKLLAISYLRQGQYEAAETRRRWIERNLRNVSGYEDALAEIEIEKGMAHQREKDFDLALDSFDRVRKRFRRSVWTNRAEFETGRVLLITNRTEKALEVLTAMPSKYPDDPVLDRVYLNLGDHYFRSQQFDNALEAFRNVVDTQRDPEITPLAMRYLIRVYEVVGMFDAALWMTRRYLEAFPDAEDHLQKQVQIGLFYMQLKEYADAIGKLHSVKYLADAETEAEIQYWIGKCHAEMGQFRQAIYEFLKVKYISKPTKLPWASTAVFEAARIYERLREPGKARQLYELVVASEGRTSDLGRIAQQKIDEMTRALADQNTT
ncbi:MAG TPA: tetratricopeptide repeat protein [bacterium]|nr:tetratricopeptide repeat protein [bacterium]